MTRCDDASTSLKEQPEFSFYILTETISFTELTKLWLRHLYRMKKTSSSFDMIEIALTLEIQIIT